VDDEILVAVLGAVRQWWQRRETRAWLNGEDGGKNRSWRVFSCHLT
jgi:hypothetical protein